MFTCVEEEAFDFGKNQIYFRQAKVSVERDDLLLDLLKIILFTFLNNKFAHWCMYDQVPNLTNINVWFQLKHYIRSDLTICVDILIKNMTVHLAVRMVAFS